MYSGFGVFRATNKGGCNHDFFRCCKVHFVIMSQLEKAVYTLFVTKRSVYPTLLQAAREMGLDGSEIKSCCNQRFYLMITR